MSDSKRRWLRNSSKSAVEPPLEPPIHLGNRSNGECFHQATPRERLARRLILERAEEGARRHGLHRREFLASGLGLATSLSVLNLVNGCGPTTPGSGGTAGRGGSAGSGGSSGGAGVGGYYDAGPDPLDASSVCEHLLDPSKEFIFDVQTHHVNRSNSPNYQEFLTQQPEYLTYCAPRGTSALGCFSRNEYIRLVFLESDTRVAVLTGLPATEDTNPITNAEIAETREIINLMADRTQRLINHAMVLPNQTADLESHLNGMQRIKEEVGVGAWKCYPAWDPTNTKTAAYKGWFFDTPMGQAVIEKGRSLGVKTFCIHKGLPIPGFSDQYNSPRDIGVVAKQYPDVKFIIYHSGYGNAGGYVFGEGAYTQGSQVGTNSVITTLLENGIGPNQNVYAELGTTWQLVKNNLNLAAHVIGKLLKYVGENNVVWGTDSIWYGSPQEQIQAFLQFNYTDAFAATYGYPPLTLAIKRKILGLNAAAAYGIDPVATRCAIDRSELAQYKRELDEELGTYRWALNRPALTSRREFFELLKARRGPG